MGNSRLASAGQKPLVPEFPGIRDRFECPHMEQWEREREGAIEGKGCLESRNEVGFEEHEQSCRLQRAKHLQGKLELTHSWEFGRSRQWEDCLMGR